MIVLLVLFYIFLALGIVVFLKYLAIPYYSRQYRLWLSKRALRRMANGKPDEVKKELNKIADLLGDVMKQDKM